jgi:hypothetical protein
VKKILLSLSVILVAAATIRIFAQSSPSASTSPTPSVDAQSNAPVATPSPSPSVSIEPPSLIPENILPAPNALPKIPSAPDIAALSAFFKQTSLGKKADEQRLHLETAKLEVQIRNDSELHQLRADALRERTDLERRHRLRTYYQAYYKKLRGLATTPELKKHIDAEEAGRELSLLQPKVRHETDQAVAAELAKARAGASATPALPTPIQARASEALRP